MRKDSNTERATLVRPSRLLKAETLRLDRERIVYRDPPRGACQASIAPTRNLFLDFMDLRDADGARIARFARQWGPLRICHHGRVRFTCSTCSDPLSAEYDLPGTPPERSESLDGWRALAADAAWVWKTLDDFKPKPREVVAHGWSMMFEKCFASREAERKRDLYPFIATLWFGLDSKPLETPYLAQRWRGGKLVASLAGFGLMGVVGVQLFGALASPGCRCTHCKRLFRPGRVPANAQPDSTLPGFLVHATGAESWCPDCRVRTGAAQRSRERYARLRTALRLRADGVPPEEIAQRVRARGGLPQVLAWIRKAEQRDRPTTDSA